MEPSHPAFLISPKHGKLVKLSKAQTLFPSKKSTLSVGVCETPSKKKKKKKCTCPVYDTKLSDSESPF